MSTLEIRNAVLAYAGQVVAKELSLSFVRPEVVSIIGPNGSGKSTLLKALGRLLVPTQGAVYLNGQNMQKLSVNATARELSVLPQSAQAPGDMTIRDLAMCGRMPYQSALSAVGAEDARAVEKALKAAGLLQMQHRRLDKLSGGERQRAWLAMAIAQEPKILLLDEPTTYLDIHYQLELMELVRRLHKELNITVIMVMHDLNHAARFSQRLIAVKNGKIMADGSVAEVFTKETLESLYDVSVEILDAGAGEFQQKVCFPYKAGKI